MSQRVWTLLVVAVVVAGGIAAWIAPPNAAFTPGTSALTFIAFVAVAIERLLEMWWGLVGGRLGGWWPLNQVVRAMADAESQANLLLNPLVSKVQSALNSQRALLLAANQSTVEIDAQIRDLQEERTKLQARLATAQSLAPGSARMAMVTRVVADGADVANTFAARAGEASATLRRAIDAARQGTDLATSVVGSFGDNPARRMMSILLGASLGMLAAGFIGLNLFAAILTDERSLLTGLLGILLTGVVMGLGSSPTHEVIKAVQQYKESRNSTTPAVGDRRAAAPRVELMAGGRTGGRTSDAGVVPLRSTD